jgi:hypothetical protein
MSELLAADKLSKLAEASEFRGQARRGPGPSSARTDAGMIAVRISSEPTYTRPRPSSIDQDLETLDRGGASRPRRRPGADDEPRQEVGNAAEPDPERRHRVTSPPPQAGC